ncbi:LAFE_0D11408g1_1 [Lachancea fermentati]|uniref:LAFE_0D11408g1_1 n=1 Tax=Lachancea fermentati TaxID=4955 RepID=A0A1G4MC12_LACFM|nr:LAFE_0D11408g1_1 [Lachancea fermentati]
MFAKAAASATAPIVKGGVYLDSFDVKLVQYRAAINKLSEIVRVLKILENSLNRKNETREIIPLLNYILALCQGPAFNVSQTLRKRLQLLSEFRLCKLGDVNPTVGISPIDLGLDLPEVLEDIEEYKAKVYDADLQGKILQSTLKISQNALVIYNQKFKQCTMERNSSRPTDISGRPISLEEKSFDELLKPIEISISLDLAVLINNFEVDTSLKSFRKLNFQVLVKFKDYINEKALPSIKVYYTSLFRFARAKTLSQAKVIMNLPYWQYTMHRIYAMLLRIKYLHDVIKTLTRQIYIPNKPYFHDPKIKLLAENVFDYEGLLNGLDSLCSPMDGSMELAEQLESYSKQGTTFAVQPTNILNAYNNSVTPAVQMLRSYMQTIDSWVSMWKFINQNTSAVTIEEIDPHEMKKMLEERLVIDKLDHVEKEKQKELAKKQKQESINGGTSNEKGVKTIFRRSSLRNSSTSSSSSVSNSPGNLSPAKLSRSSSHELKRIPTSLKSQSRNGSGLSSPLVSRRGSVSEKAARSPVSKLSSERSAQAGKASSHLSEETSRRNGRKRSVSLQSSSEPPKNIPDIEKERSNSLQASASLNQRMVQNAFLHLSGDLSGKGLASGEGRSRRILKTPATSKKLLRSGSPSPLRHKNSVNKSQTKTKDDNELPKIDSLTIDEETTKELVSGQSSTSLSCDEKEADTGSSNEKSEEDSDSVMLDTNELVKKVRFTGVPPMSSSENPRPKRKGWYKKPAVLHYPPPPPQFAIQQYKLRQEGLAFRKSLREDEQENTPQRKNLMFTANESQHSGHKLANKLRDKLAR